MIEKKYYFRRITFLSGKDKNTSQLLEVKNNKGEDIKEIDINNQKIMVDNFFEKYVLGQIPLYIYHLNADALDDDTFIYVNHFLESATYEILLEENGYKELLVIDPETKELDFEKTKERIKKIIKEKGNIKLDDCNLYLDKNNNIIVEMLVENKKEEIFFDYFIEMKKEQFLREGKIVIDFKW